MKTFFFFRVILASLLFASQVHASCGTSFTDEPNPAPSGCEQLQIVIHNQTNYTFKKDVDYTSVAASGGSPYGDVNSFTPTLGPGDSTLIFNGVSAGDNDKDKVDASMRYYAYYEDKRVGPQLMIYAAKASCNVKYNARITFYDQRCYDESHIAGSKTCTLNGNCSGGCSYCSDDSVCLAYDSAGNCTASQCVYTHYKDYICKSSFAYKGYECSYTNSNGVYVYTNNNPVVSGSVTTPSSGAAGAGIFTIGSTFDADGMSTGEVSSQPYTTYTHFTCTKDSECGDTKNGSCLGGSNLDNKPTKLAFYIKPSLAEKLTITFPFNPKTPIAKVMKDSIYNNLNAKYVGQLGIYFSFSPVVMGDKTLDFTTLCNSVSCP